MSSGKDGKNVTPTIPQYYVGAQFAICVGPIDYIKKILVSEKLAWEGEAADSTITIDKRDLFGGDGREGGVAGKVDLDFGAATQTQNTYLQSILGSAIPAFKGVVCAVLNQVYIGNNYYLKPWTFQVSRIHTIDTGQTQWQDSLSEVPTQYFSVSGITRDGTTATVTSATPHGLKTGETVTILGATDELYNKTGTITVLTDTTFTYVLADNPTDNATGSLQCEVHKSGLINAAHIIRECLTNTEWGSGHDVTLIDDAAFLEAAQTLYDERLGFSFLWDSTQPIVNFTDTVNEHIDAVLYEDRKTGKFVLKLIRQIAESELDTLLVLDENNIKDVTDLKRRQIGELYSSVTVKFENILTGKGDETKAINISLTQRQTSPVNKSLDMAGVVNRFVAAKIAQRELRQNGTPLFSATLICNREAENLNVGDAFILDWPDLIDAKLTMRVSSINLGTSTNSAITIDCIQDIFTASDVVFSSLSENYWVDPINEPQPVEYRVMQEIPYYTLARARGDTFAQAVPADTSYFIISGAKPTSDSYGATIYSGIFGAGPFGPKGYTNFCFHTRLAEDITKTSTVLTITSTKDIELLKIGSYLQIGDELMGIVSYTGNAITVTRGALDTVPEEHAGADFWSAGSHIFAWGNHYGSDQVAYLTGEEVQGLLGTITPKGTLAEANTVYENSITIDNRLHKPYPPANVKFNGAYWPAIIDSPITLTWATRNRLQQTTSVVDWYSGNITSEVGVTYTIEITDLATLTVIYTASGITGTSQIINVYSPNQCVLKIWSYRAGIACFQFVYHIFEFGAASTGSYTWDDFTKYTKYPTWDN